MTRIYFRLLGVFVAAAILAGGWCGCVRPIPAPAGPTEKREAQTPNGNPSVDAGSAPDAAIESTAKTEAHLATTDAEEEDGCLVPLCVITEDKHLDCALITCAAAEELQAEQAREEAHSRGLRSF